MFRRFFSSSSTLSSLVQRISSPEDVARMGKALLKEEDTSSVAAQRPTSVSSPLFVQPLCSQTKVPDGRIGQLFLRRDNGEEVFQVFTTENELVAAFPSVPGLGCSELPATEVCELMDESFKKSGKSFRVDELEFDWELMGNQIQGVYSCDW
jgi:hypothetical protein